MMLVLFLALQCAHILQQSLVSSLKVAKELLHWAVRFDFASWHFATRAASHLARVRRDHFTSARTHPPAAAP